MSYAPDQDYVLSVTYHYPDPPEPAPEDRVISVTFVVDSEEEETDA